MSGAGWCLLGEAGLFGALGERLFDIAHGRQPEELRTFGVIVSAAPPDKNRYACWFDAERFRLLLDGLQLGFDRPTQAQLLDIDITIGN